MSLFVILGVIVIINNIVHGEWYITPINEYDMCNVIGGYDNTAAYLINGNGKNIQSKFIFNFTTEQLNIIFSNSMYDPYTIYYTIYFVKFFICYIDILFQNKQCLNQ